MYVMEGGNPFSSHARMGYEQYDAMHYTTLHLFLQRVSSPNRHAYPTSPRPPRRKECHLSSLVALHISNENITHPAKSADSSLQGVRTRNVVIFSLYISPFCFKGFSSLTAMIE